MLPNSGKTNESSTQTTNTTNPASIQELSQEQATTSNAIDIPSLSLPKGGGALKGIDEKFEVNAANGTASFSIPLPITPGRNGFAPALSLAYNSGAGNSPYGLGWSVGYLMIQRRTDKVLPRYKVGEEEDVFMLSGMEDLVPVLDRSDNTWVRREHTEGTLTITAYRPRIEGGFDRIEKITGDSNTYWKLTTRNNTTTFFGLTKAAQLCDPEDDRRIFAWLPEFSCDDKGNWMTYEYKPEDLENVPQSLHERNRHQGLAPFTNRYLKRVKYGNRVAFYPDHPYAPTLPAAEVDFFFELVMDYGEHLILASADGVPTYEERQPWLARSDAFSSYRSGFEIRTYRLCHRILLFHHFPEEQNFDESAFGRAQLVRMLGLSYEPSSINGTGQTEVSYLSRIQSTGFVRFEEQATLRYSQKSLPPLEFEYQELTWSTTVQLVDKEAIANAPVGLTDGYQWVDLFGEGVSGILTEQADAWFYKENYGTAAADQRLSFAPAKKVLPKPSFLGLNTGVLTLQDLEANGQKQIVVNAPGLQGYFELDSDDTYQAFRSFEHQHNVNLLDPNVRLLDLDGDGQPELVLTEEAVLTWYAADGKRGHQPAEFVPKGFDEERGPALVFEDNDRQEAIFLADVTGDGLTDIVRIRNGAICYWANKGFGRFSAKVNMSNAPIFDHTDAFHLRYIQFADVSGTGAADLVYLGKNKFKAYINLSGNAWSDAHLIDPCFPIDSQAQLSVIDLLGTGTSCIVWSSNLPGEAHAPMRYIDLMSSRKPHLLSKCINNMGKETTLEYKSATHFYIQDKLAGNPWITKLPFPVQVLYRTILEEKITQVRFSTEYRYHHGYYDHSEREFRGFGMVEQLDTEFYQDWQTNNAGNQLDQSEVLYQAPTLTKTWFHTGPFLDRERLLSQFEQEYWYEEYNRRFPAEPIQVSEFHLPDALVKAADSLGDPALINQMSVKEWREALRACKGMMLRQEVFSLDADDNPAAVRRQAKPYSVATHNCHIQLLQPRTTNPYAVFTVTESEAITIHYERDERDPRVAHNLNLRLDELGNVLEAAAVVYPRLVDDPNLPADVQAEQRRTHIILTATDFTSDVVLPDAYRLRLPAESRTYEITGLEKNSRLYQLSDLEGILERSTEIAYHITASSGVQHRLIEQVRSLFFNDELTDPLQLGQLASHGIPYESYQLAYTPDVLQDIFGDKIEQPEVDMTEGRFVHSEGDTNWWIRSGLVAFREDGDSLDQVKARFLSPLAYTDPFGSVTRVSYYKDYFLMLAATTDALQNEVRVEAFDFRLLAPTLLRDLNDNLSAVVFDELGLVKAAALLGKDLNGDNSPELELCDEISGVSSSTSVEEGDIQAFFQSDSSLDLNTVGARLLQRASSRFVYDFEGYRLTGRPVVSASIVREMHHHHLSDGTTVPLQLAFEYTDGLGKVVMTKTQAEPGLALQVSLQEDQSYVIDEIDTNTAFADGVRLRWIGNGRTVLNNKGNPVKQFEPYFSVSPHFEDAPELVEMGVTSTVFYDAPGRVIKTLMPDLSFSRVEFDAWKQLLFDNNDTVMDSAWYQKRINPTTEDLATFVAEGKDPAKERVAAEKAAVHHGTPQIIHFDALGRPFFTVAHNRDELNGDQFFETRIQLDIEGNVRQIIDARGNRLMSWSYDLLGHRVYEDSMDKGARWVLPNVMGNPIKSWDSREHLFLTSYDLLQRPLEFRVLGGDGASPLDHIFEKMIYGEALPNAKERNFRGLAVESFDTAGKVTIEEVDLKGNVTRFNRRFTLDYKQTVNWTGDLDALLENESFTELNRFDALNRHIHTETPDASIIEPIYNEANLLDQVVVTQEGVRQAFVKDMRYDAKGQRESIVYGNDVKTTYNYDRETFRLLRLHSQHVDPNGGNGNNTPLQDLRYTFDPVGNITHLEDQAISPVFFGNDRVDPLAQYTYDALYRLIEASGREHATQLTHANQDNWNDLPFLKRYQAGDAFALRNYRQSYQYDSVGNILQMRHVAAGGSWTRDYEYEGLNNRLRATTVGAQRFDYQHHPAHGFITELPHLEVMDWNFRDELKAVAKQRLTNGIPETTYYVYDGNGERVRKVTEHQVLNGGVPTKKEERFYLGGFEIYRKHSGQDRGLERATLHIMDDTRRIALIDTRNEVDDDTDRKTIRFQLANHLGSASLETNEEAEIISYEEHHPYGTTAFQAVNASIRAAAKRYRYTGMERDEESGLDYHSARYYLVWLGRWLKPDPIGVEGGVNLYSYCGNDPIGRTDMDGTDWCIFCNPFSDDVKVFGSDIADDIVKGAGDVAVDAWEFTEEEIAPRVEGGLKATVGFAGMVAGGLLCKTGVGCVVGGPLLVASADYGGSGLSQVVSGKPEKTLIGTVLGPQAQEVQESVVEGAALVHGGISVYQYFRSGSTAFSEGVTSFFNKAKSGGRTSKATSRNTSKTASTPTKAPKNPNGTASETRGTAYHVKGQTTRPANKAETELFRRSRKARREISKTTTTDGKTTTRVGQRTSVEVEVGSDVAKTVHTHPQSGVALFSKKDLSTFQRYGYSDSARHSVIGLKWPNTRRVLSDLGINPGRIQPSDVIVTTVTSGQARSSEVVSFTLKVW